MSPAEARRKMLHPRATRRYKDIPTAGWYYIEEEGLTVLAPPERGDALCVRLSWEQVEQALAIKRLAASAGESTK